MKYSMSVWVFVWYDHLIKEVSRIQTGISICYIPSLLAIQKCTFILYVKYRFIILKWFTNKDIFLNSILWIYFSCVWSIFYLWKWSSVISQLSVIMVNISLLFPAYLWHVWVTSAFQCFLFWVWKQNHGLISTDEISAFSPISKSEKYQNL